MNLNLDLIKEDINSEDDDLYNYNQEDSEKLNSESSTDDFGNNSNEIILIQKDNIESDEPKVMQFIKFCIKNGIFDDTFYDYNNSFSVIATKLPTTFDKISNDGVKINKEAFIKFFKETSKYTGDTEFIFDCIDVKKNNYITWEQFADFYLPFIKFVTL